MFVKCSVCSSIKTKKNGRESPRHTRYFTTINKPGDISQTNPQEIPRASSQKISQSNPQLMIHKKKPQEISQRRSTRYFTQARTGAITGAFTKERTRKNTRQFTNCCLCFPYCYKWSTAKWRRHRKGDLRWQQTIFRLHVCNVRWSLDARGRTQIANILKQKETSKHTIRNQ